MHPHAHLLHRFFAAYAESDGDGIAGFYHPSVRYSDPVFGALTGSCVLGMARLLCAVEHGRKLVCTEVQTEDPLFVVRWETHYIFAGTGRPVRKIVESRFRFTHGRIVEQTDRFAFWGWSAMALGPVGWLFGWTSLLRNSIRRDMLTALILWNEAKSPRPDSARRCDLPSP